MSMFSRLFRRKKGGTLAGNFLRSWLKRRGLRR